jgi:chorismate mutase/prephenate dehydratase
MTAQPEHVQPETVQRDPVVTKFRDEIGDLDRQLVAIVNKRLRVVAALRGYKEANGIPFFDPAREEWMLRYLTRANSGPISSEGLAELYAHILELTKREITAE